MSGYYLSEHINSFISEKEYEAILTLRAGLKTDVAKTSKFWESIVALIVAGEETAHKCPWDVELNYGEELVRIEVKYSQEFLCQFTQGPRNVFKFASPKGVKKEKVSDVTVFMGIDEDDSVYSWVMPSLLVKQVKSITLTSPKDRVGSNRSVLGPWICPPTQLLPEVLRAYHYDKAAPRGDTR